MKHEGNLIIRKGDVTDYSLLKEVTSSLNIYSDAKLDAPNLTTVGGSLYINSDAKLDAPNLTTVGGYLYIYSDAKLDAPNLTTVGGSLNINSDAKLPNLTTVGGYLYINSDAKLPNLTTVGGYLSIYSDAKLPNLTTVGDSLNIYSDAKLPNLTTVGGYLYIYSDAKLDAPNLTTVGDSLNIYSDAKLDAPFLKGLKWKSIDGYLFVIESTKVKGDTTIYKGYNIKNVKGKVITKDECYVAEQGVYYAHGKTIKKAVEDVNFKTISEKLKKEPINKDTVINMNYYRLITGACEMGVQSFIKGNGLKESYKASELLPILEQSNAYGLSKFKELLTF